MLQRMRIRDRLMNWETRTTDKSNGDSEQMKAGKANLFHLYKQLKLFMEYIENKFWRKD